MYNINPIWLDSSRYDKYRLLWLSESILSIIKITREALIMRRTLKSWACGQHRKYSLPINAWMRWMQSTRGAVDEAFDTFLGPRPQIQRQWWAHSSANAQRHRFALWTILIHTIFPHIIRSNEYWPINLFDVCIRSTCSWIYLLCCAK